MASSGVVAVVCGMLSEWQVVNQVPGVLALYGVARDHLDEAVPANCVGLVSFGVAGGLAPRLRRGNLVIGTSMITDNQAHQTAAVWVGRIGQLLASLPAVQTAVGFSDPNVWITDPARRAEFHLRTRAEFCDNESCRVAKLAAARNLPFVVVRAISDESDDTVINNPGEVNPDGTPNLLIDLRDFASDPISMIQESIGFGQAMYTLKQAVPLLGDQLAFS